MPDVCSIKISPALARVFDRHNDNIYRLSWYHGIICTYGGKMQIAYEIEKQYGNANRKNARKFKGTPQIKGVMKFIDGTHEFLEDFKRLGHGDIERIKSMSIYETMNSPITTINNQPIEREG